MTMEAEGPTPAAQPDGEAATLRQVKNELSEKIERECAHVDAVLSERIDGVRVRWSRFFGQFRCGAKVYSLG